MRYLALDHVAIAVKSREASIPLFRDTLGMKLGRSRQSVATGVNNVHFPFEDGHYLALVEPMEPGNAVDRSIQKRGEGVYVLSIEIENLQAAKQELSARGVRLVNTAAAKGPIFIHPLDANGMFIQLTQRVWPDSTEVTTRASHPDAAYRWLDHVVIAVRDLEQAVANFRDQLGFRLERTAVMPEMGIKQAFFAMQDGHFIELAEPLGAETAVGRALQRRGEGPYLVCLAVRNLAQRVQALKANGAQLVAGEGGRMFIHPKSARGALIQIVERP